MEEENFVFKRIAVGISAGAGLLALFFSVWALVANSVQPVIGNVVFQCISWMSSVFLVIVVVLRAERI